MATESSDIPATPAHVERWHATPAEGRALPLPAGNLAAPVLAYGSMLVEHYAPRGVDTQQPHTRDELYVVIAGTG